MTASETSSLLPESGRKETASRSYGWKVTFLVGASCLIIGYFGGSFLSYRKNDDSMPPKVKRNSKYTATQFISFSINTLGGLAEFGECNNRTVDDSGVCYLGNEQDIEEDLQHRFQIVKEVLHTLKEDRLNEFPEIDAASHVLKIFMLPEFFLRGPEGAYSTEQMKEGGMLIEISDDIRDLVTHEAFDDFLFVFGTVVVAQSPDDPSKPWEISSQNIEKGDVLYYNLAPVMRGGKHNQHKRYLVPKRYISTADFLDRKNGLPDPRRSHLSEYDHLAMDKELLSFLTDIRNITIVNDNILDIDGIRIGIEICLDHRLGVMWDVLRKNGGELVDVHLITSAGMAIERGPTPVRPGGVVYLTDGEGSSAVCQRSYFDQKEFDPNVVCRDRHNDGPTGLKHIPNNGAEGYSSYIELATCLNPDDAPWKPLIEGYYSNHATQGCAYTLKLHGIDVFDEYDFYPPSIEIYPTIDLP